MHDNMKSKVLRKTKETNVAVSINLRGGGKHKIFTTIPFLDHMLSVFSMHGLIDLTLQASGDTDVDQHHLVEDVGITLGTAIRKALGSKKGISRYGNFLVPMDEALSYVVVDISSRPYLHYNVRFRRGLVRGDFDFGLIEDFFRAVATNGGLTLHISLQHGKNNHHICESIFKGFGKALSIAVRPQPGLKGCPSTKGKL